MTGNGIGTSLTSLSCMPFLSNMTLICNSVLLLKLTMPKVFPLASFTEWMGEPSSTMKLTLAPRGLSRATDAIILNDRPSPAANSAPLAFISAMSRAPASNAWNRLSVPSKRV